MLDVMQREPEGSTTSACRIHACTVSTSIAPDLSPRKPSSNMPRARSTFLTYEKARDWARAQGLTSGVAFRRLGPRRPHNVPTNPNTFYRAQWINWGEFLGTGRVANQSRRFCSYHDAQAWASSMGIRSSVGWRAMDATAFPEYIPRNPPAVYKNEWHGWKAFLRPNNERILRKSVRSYSAASEWAQAKGIRTSTEWREHKRFPHDIPSAPDRAYPEEWQGWGAFLGTGRIANMEREFRPYAAAQAWARSAAIRSKGEWFALGRKKIPPDIPLDPARSYRNEWNGWGVFLGTGTVAPQHRSYRSYSDAQAWALRERITSGKMWRERMQRSHPDDIPTVPARSYASEWRGWGVFLGTGRIANQKRSYRSSADAQAWVRARGISSRAEWLATPLPPDIPAKPDRAYHDWSNWAEFLGKRMSGASIPEYVLHYELAALLPVGRRGRLLRVGSIRKRIDISLPSLKLALEYDGAYWHSQTVEKDRDETRAFAEFGWRLIRIREKPLPLISQRDDISVEETLDYRQLVFRVLGHLLAIDAIPPNRIAAVGAFIAGGKLSLSPNKISSLLGRRTYQQAKAWALAAGIKTKAEWFNRSDSLPADLPTNPPAFYPLEWTTWGDFLGTGRARNGDRVFRSYADASAWARSTGIMTGKQWREHLGRPDYLPYNPDAIYKHEWRGWGAFLGTGRVADQEREFRSYSEASAWARAHGIKSSIAWRQLSRAQIPEDIPINPDMCAAYRSEWRGWGEFLQNGRARRATV